MKKLLAFALAMAMLLCLCACGKEAPKDDTADKGGDTTATTTTTTESVTDDPTTTTAGGTDDTTTTATEGEGSTTAGTSGTGATATTTKKPTTTATIKGDDEGMSIRILAIGDGFAVDAMQNHLYDIFKSAGYSKIHLGILYAETATLEDNYNNVKSDKATYQYRENTAGKWTTNEKYAASRAFKATDWDYVVIQQAVADSGKPESFGKIKDFTSLIQNQCGDAAIYWHMTWAYRQGATDKGFANYTYNQQMMYQAILKATLQQVMVDPNVWALIPSGTTIQNLRTTSLKDGLTNVGARLNDTYGDYAAALTWYCTLTGESTDTITYRPSPIKESFDEIAEVTPSTKGDGEFKSISILAVGNSFSVDAMTNHLYGMLEGAGYDDIHLGILYVGGCSIDMHYNYFKNNSASYEYMENTNGKWNNTKNYQPSAAFALRTWDYVIVQQVSGYSGIPSSYGNLDALMDLIKSQSRTAKIFWQMTWAYQGNSSHSDFPKYGKDQMTMYNAIVSTVKEKIVGNPDFNGVIPSGTAVQNARTSTLGDNLTADGYHLENAYGDYIAALTWYCTLTGEGVYDTVYCPSSVVDHHHEIAEAVSNAVKKPFEVTESQF